jgi:hypothetical protein
MLNVVTLNDVMLSVVAPSELVEVKKMEKTLA